MVRADLFGQRGSQRNDILAASQCSPRSQHVGAIVSERPDQSDVAYSRRKREQRRAVRTCGVFQEHEGAFGGGPCQVQAFRLQHRGSFQLFIGIGAVKKAKREFHPQNAAYPFIHRRLRDFSRAHQLRHVIVIQAADHVDIHASQKRFARGGGAVVGDAVGNQFRDRRPVAVHDSAKSPLFP